MSSPTKKGTTADRRWPLSISCPLHGKLFLVVCFVQGFMTLGFVLLCNRHQHFRYDFFLDDINHGGNEVRINFFKNTSFQYDQAYSDNKLAGGGYLLYYSHSGFTNQLIAMESAAYFALATKRTLVLPPILPHHTSDEEDPKFTAFEARAAGTKCRPYDSYHEFIETVREDVEKARSDPDKFPSFMELFDFDYLSKKTGLSVIDMTEFAKDTSNANVTLWCTGETDEIEKMMVPACDKGEKMSFNDLVPRFQRICGLDQRVAVIGSPFVMPSPENIHRYGASENFGFKEMLTPSRKFLSVVNQIYARLPEDFTGVHIGFRDNLEVDSCEDPNVKEAFLSVFDDLAEQETPGKGHILMGNGNQAALECFLHYAQGRFTASSINDIIDGDEALQQIVDEIKVERETSYVLMDQILIALARRVSFQRVATNAISTFQRRIRVWHDRRESFLEKMQSV